MAAQPQVINQIDFDLNIIASEVADLPLVAEMWDQHTESDRITFALEWKDTADGIKLLDRAYRSGQMTPAQQAGYRELLGKLKEALPIIERLNLYRPPVPLETS